MKILLFGKNGQVGWELNRALSPLGEVVALDRADVDFLDLESLRKSISDVAPNIIVNAVAYTAVDKAEENEEIAGNINGAALGVLAEETLRLNALLVHYSTDYVFDGTKSIAYDELDKPNPINAYGRTKLEGEQHIQTSGCDYLIFRTSWVYAPRGHNFLLSILKLAKEREELSIVSDQVGSPTSARLIAETTSHCLAIAIKAKQSSGFSSGIYHLTSSGHTSWYGFTEEIIKVVKNSTDIHLKIKTLKAISTSEYPTAAKRPQNSRLALDKLEDTFKLCMPSWQSGLALCLEELK